MGPTIELVVGVGRSRSSCRYRRDRNSLDMRGFHLPKEPRERGASDGSSPFGKLWRRRRVELRERHERERVFKDSQPYLKGAFV